MIGVSRHTILAVRVFVLGSGSSGNALVVEADGTRVLVDAGIGPKVAKERLRALGVEPEDYRVDAIVATHHHGDHFDHVEKLARAFGATIWLHRGIDAPRVRRKHAVSDYAPGASFRVGALAIATELVPHDAPQVAVRIASEHHAVGIATDVGHVTSRLVGLIASCDAAIVEANFCPELLGHAPYPEALKRRIGGGFGHLSNAQASELARRVSGSRLGQLWLGHLSKIANTEERAIEAVAAAAPKLEVGAIPHGVPCTLDVRRLRPLQLGLPFEAH